jgi:hypothetical protein
VAREGPVEAAMPTMPSDVPPPAECEPWGSGGRHWHDPDNPTGWFQIAEMRHVVPGPDGFGGGIWARMRSEGITRATAAFLADMVPSSVVRAAGRMGGGTSLDNSMRFGPMVETEWILLDMDPWLGSGGYLHGAARVWSEDGTLLGVASQSASAMVWEGDVPPWLEETQTNR